MADPIITEAAKKLLTEIIVAGGWSQIDRDIAEPLIMKALAQARAEGRLAGMEEERKAVADGLDVYEVTAIDAGDFKAAGVAHLLAKSVRARTTKEW